MEDSEAEMSLIQYLRDYGLTVTFGRADSWPCIFSQLFGATQHWGTEVGATRSLAERINMV